MAKTDNPFVSLRWAVGGLLAIGLISRLLGLVREIVIAGSFGANTELDAVYLGIAVPIAFCLGLGGGFGRAIVPVASTLEERFLGGLFIRGLARVLSIAGIAAAALFLTSPLWTALLTPAGSDVAGGQVLIAGALGSFAVLGGALSGFAAGVSNARGRHLTANFTAFLHNGFIILSVILLSPWLGAFSLLAGLILAEYGQTLALLPFIRKILRRLHYPGPEALRAMDSLLWPAMILAASGSLMAAVDRSFSASLPGGAVSALSYAERLLNFPVVLAAMAVATPLYTRLSRFHGEGRSHAFDLTLLLGLRGLLFLGMPMGLLVAGFAEPLISLLLERGAFTAEDSARAGEALSGYALAIAFQGMLPLLISAALARGKPWTMVTVSAAALILNAVLDAILVGPFGLFGIAAATSIVSTVTALTMVSAVAPSILRRRDFWRAITGGFLIYTLGMGFVTAYRQMAGPHPEGFFPLAGYLAGGGITVTALTAFCLYLIVKREWAELRQLRTSAARAGQILEREQS